MIRTTETEAVLASTIGRMNFALPMAERARYHANDSSRDVLSMEERPVPILDGRRLEAQPSLDREGFRLVSAPTAVKDFRDSAQVSAVYAAEILELVRRETGADEVALAGGGVLRFAENSAESGQLNNSRPARFVHNDVSEATAQGMAAKALADLGAQGEYRSFALYNIWRPFSPPPQNVPLAMLDGRSLDQADLIAADAVFDEAGKPDWSFEGYIVRHNPHQRWIYYPDMGAGDALMFTTFAYRDGKPFYVPHSGFDDPACPTDAPPRASIEMRAFAFFR